VPTTAIESPPLANRQMLAEGQGESGSTLQLVSFRLGSEEYGVEILAVREIILLGPITRMPQTPPYVRGLINLRSSVIPIIDLRLRFGMPEQAATEDSRIMVVDVAGKTIGMIVDAVNQVLRVSTDEIVPSPPAVAGLQCDYLTGLVKIDQRLLILLDIHKLLCSTDEGDADFFSSLEGKEQNTE